MTRYAIARHVFVCRDGAQLVLLDLLHDRYWALEASSAAGLEAVIAGWPTGPPLDFGSVPPLPADLTALLDLLVERKLATENVAEGKDATPVTLAIPTTELMTDEESAVQWPVSLWRVPAAAVMAGIALTVLPIRWVVRRVGRRKESHRGRGTRVDVARARQLVAAFAHYRAFVFSSRDHCLLDSLSLIEFLAGYGMYPDWVFGVQTRPFAAHCWVQQDDLLFNDSIARICGYTPIMVV